MATNKVIPNQTEIKETLHKIPIEFFKWGTFPDHYKIDMPHRHDFVEFLFFIKGGGFHEIDFIRHEVQNNSIHIIPASTVHFLKRDKSSEGFTIAFDSQFLDANTIHRIVYPMVNEHAVINLSNEKFEFIMSITKMILQQVELNKGYYREKGFLVALELLINAIAQEIQAEQKMGEKKDRILSAFKLCLDSNIRNQTSVKFYAKSLNISAKYLSNYLKDKTNKSAKQWILDSLIFSVKKLLINTDLSIKQIAYRHQYNESSLSKLFKKQVGYTMTQYRSNKNMSF